MKFRRRMSRHGSRKHFSHNARRVHIKNAPHTVCRGGIRL